MYIELLTLHPKAVLGVAQTSVMLLAHIDTPPYFTDASTDGLALCGGT